MASIADYIRAQRVEQNNDIESLLRNASTYQRNKQLLEAFGREGEKAPAPGLLTRTLNLLEGPARVARAGLLYAAGRPTQEMQEAAGLGELTGLLSGRIDVSADELIPRLRSQEGDPLLDRISKGVTRFGVDVATDPLSFVTAPASVSRKFVADRLISVAGKGEFLDDLVRASKKGEGLIDELAASSKLGRVAKAAKQTGEEALETGTAAAVSRLGTRGLAQQELQTRLATALQAGGRRGLVKELELLTGSQKAARDIFKKLPDDVRGGVVLSNIFGRPLGEKSGRPYVRLTSGTGDILGGVGDAANAIRRAVAAGPGAAVSSRLGGEAGSVLAAVRRSQLNWKPGQVAEGVSRIGPVNIRDYFMLKEALRLGKGQEAALVSKGSAAVHTVAQRANAIAEDSRDTFFDKMSEFVFTPAAPVNVDALDDVSRAAYDSAQDLRNQIIRINDEAQAAGIELRGFIDPENYAPLMMTDEYFERLRKQGRSVGSGSYRSEMGRDSYIETLPDIEAARLVGSPFADTPEIVALSPREINRRLGEKAFIEDPVIAVQRYTEQLAKKIANKRTVDRLVETGVVVEVGDIPKRLLQEHNASVFIRAISALSPELRQAAEQRQAAATEKLGEVISTDTVDDLQRRIAAARQQAISDSQVAEVNLETARREFLDASAEVAEIEPTIPYLKGRLRQYEQVAAEPAVQMQQAQRSMKNVRARLRTAQGNIAENVNAAQLLQAQLALTTDPIERQFLTSRLAAVTDDMSSAATKVSQEDALRAEIGADLENLKTVRAEARTGAAQELQQRIAAYEAAVARKATAAGQMQSARQARTAARNRARAAEREIGLDQIKNVDAVVRNYVEAEVALREFKATNRTSRTMTDEQRQAITERVAALTATRDSAKKLVKDLSRLGKDSPLYEVADEYLKRLNQVIEAVSPELADAAILVSSSNKMLDFVEVYRAGGRSDREVLQAVGDLVETWGAVRSRVSKDVLKSMDDATAAINLNGNLGKVKAQFFRETEEPGLLANALAEDGFEAIANVKGMKNLYADASIRELFENIHRAPKTPEGWSRLIGDFIDPMLQMWRLAITIGRGPGYLINNATGAMVANYYGGVAASDLSMAVKALADIRNTVDSIIAKNPTISPLRAEELATEQVSKALKAVKVGDADLDQLLAEFLVRGGADSTEAGFIARELSQRGAEVGTQVYRRGAIMRPTYTTEPAGRAEAAFRKTIDFAMTNAVQRALNNAAQSTEMAFRFSTFIDGYRRYGDFRTAMAKVHMLHFDYQDLSNAEVWLKRFVPFYTWTRNNVPASLRVLMLQPGKLQRFMYANDTFAAAMGAEGDESWLNQILPEFIDVQDGFASRIKIGDNNLGFFLKLPAEDINRLFKVEGGLPSLRWRELGNLLGPALKVPVEAATGIDLQTGQQFEDKLVSAPGALRALNVLGPLGGPRPVSVTAEGETLAPAGLMRALQTIIPQTALISGVTSTAGALLPGQLPGLVQSEDKRQRELSSALNFLGLPAAAGLGVTTITPRTISGELRRRTGRQSSEINRVARELGVDVAWLRDRLDAGASVEQIQAEVAAGFGRPQKEMKTRTDAQRRRALESLAGL